MTTLMWFRRDLRIQDNPALSDACQDKRENVIALFIITPKMWREHYNSPTQIDLILRQLKSLSKDLAKLNIPLLIRRETKQISPIKIIKQLYREHSINTMAFNLEYEVDEKARDKKIIDWCNKNSVAVKNHHDQVLIPPGMLLTKVGKPYTIFTPFSRAVFDYLQRHGVSGIVKKPRKREKCLVASDVVPDYIEQFRCKLSAELWPVGEEFALRKLYKFCEKDIFDYQKWRDFPFANKTSNLSPYLAVGIVSIKQCLHVALRANQNRLIGGDKSVSTWVNELIWREFYRHILHAFPRVCMGQPFRMKMEKIPWRNNKKEFKAWCEGKTGFPFIDAAMRQLIQTGWMHNRLRMIVAMFLTKNCLIDWRWGEKFFMQHLIDGDFASNNGGWQWSASTGTDSVPYFRIFNPVTQSERFDPHGDFIRHYCPELKYLSNKEIHDPSLRSEILPTDYPRAIIDLAASRKRALGVFKKISKL